MFVDALKGQIQPLSKRNTGRSRAILSTPIKHHKPSNNEPLGSLTSSAV